MSQGKSKTMPMQFFFGGGGVEAVYYGIVQVVNCANPKDNHDLKFIKKKQGAITAILACLIRVQLSKYIPCFESLNI